MSCHVAAAIQESGHVMISPVKVVRLANYVAPASGGLRTALRELGAGYLAAGHEPVLVIPGPRPGRRLTEQGLVITVPGPAVPGTGGYRAITARRSLRRLLDQLEPDRLETSDRTTLRWTGDWARARGIRSMMISHDSLAGLMRMFAPRGLPGALVQRLADQLNQASAASYDVVVCTTGWAAAEFRRLSVPNLLQVPLGVDLDWFCPGRRDPGLRSRLAPRGQRLLLHCSRLGPEKRSERAIGALAELRRRGVPAVLVVAGDGPRLRALQAQTGRLPVRFLRHVADRGLLARLLATADVTLAPGPVETFGLSALEALASGTPVVVSSRSALPEVVRPAGLAADDTDAAFADAVHRLLGRDEAARRQRARARAEQFGWPASVRGFLAAHQLPVPPDAAPGRAATRPGAALLGGRSWC
jgi:alpha-1,6-mannosyltransferase